MMAVLLLMAGGLRIRAQSLEVVSDFYVNYSPKPEAGAVLKHKLNILDPNAEVDLDAGHRKGTIYLAYVSVVEVVPGTRSALEAAKHSIPVLAHNASWGADVLDVTHEGWLDYVMNDLVGSALAKGFDGVFLDTLDSIERISAEHPQKAGACHTALVTLIQRLHKRFPQKRVVINRGFALLDEVSPSISGVLVESLFQGWDTASKKYIAVKPSDTQWLVERLLKVQAKKLPVYVVDYVEPGNTELAGKTVKRIQELGCVSFVTTHELRGYEFTPAIGSGN